MLADYRGKADFEVKYRATAAHNIGSVAQPMSIASASV
jgi:hypothetical protein